MLFCGEVLMKTCLEFEFQRQMQTQLPAALFQEEPDSPVGSGWGRQPLEQEPAGRPQPRASWESSLPRRLGDVGEGRHHAGSSSSGCASAPGTHHRPPGIVACDLGALEVPFLPQDGFRIIVYNCVSINMCVPFDPKSLFFFYFDFKRH